MPFLHKELRKSCQLTRRAEDSVNLVEDPGGLYGNELLNVGTFSLGPTSVDQSESDNESNDDTDSLTERDSMFRPATTVYEGAGEQLFPSTGYSESSESLLSNPWQPFKSAKEFELSRWFLRSHISQGQIDDFFRAAGAGKGSYHNGKGFTRHLDEMVSRDGLGRESWMHSEVELGGEKIAYYYRDPMSVVRFLLGQRAFRESLVYAPTMEYNELGERMYGEMHTADWWWEMQNTLPEGSTVVPVICASDGTHLTNFSGDKKAWPVYLTIGNITSEIRNKPSSFAFILLALLPVPRKLGVRANEHRRENQMALHKVLGEILEGLRGPAQNGELIACADGYDRLCFPILCAWVADQPEHASLQNINNHACPRCEVDFKGLGSLHESPPRIQERYVEIVKEYEDNRSNAAPVEYLVSKSLKTLYNAFWALRRTSAYDLHKPDILHNIYLGLLKHMMEWVQGFLKKHNRIEEFDRAWSSIGPYPGLAVPNKAYRATTQWQGKEMRHLGRIVLGAFAVALQAPPMAARKDFSRALRCVRALIDFHLMAQYTTHTKETLEYLQSYLENFHKYKDVFLEFRAYKRTRKDAKDQTKALQGSGSLGRGLEEVQEIREGSHFNFIKMHLLSHFREHVERFGNIPMFSTDVSELAHRRQIKMAYTASNKVDATVQILDYHPRRMVMEMRVLNLKDIVFSLPEHYEGLPSHRESLRDLLEIFKNEDQQRGGSERLLDGDAPQKPKMTTPDNSATRLSDIADIIKMNRTTLARAVSEYDQGLQREEGGLLSLLDYPVRYFKCLQVPVSVFQKSDSYEIHNIRCTGEALFRKRAVRNDWAWIKVATTDP
ncbi:uncharacterized protein LAJ45_08801 [Morchella importuna]|uniref:uncharacterized protein n=1 Tax=Morchella importuna TaxID=1174673 RepID=UPI001E8E5663|nr:uncharacterized protein LAJ45_08801 [Morchella importuna]KAH8147002.1 hypothetical protein LAJ45_08801 [Morchella importuna]